MVTQCVATDDYINSGLHRQTARMTSGTVEAFAGHVPLELLSRFHATGCTRDRCVRRRPVNSSASHCDTFGPTSPKQPSFSMYFLMVCQMRLSVRRAPPVACSNFS